MRYFKAISDFKLLISTISLPYSKETLAKENVPKGENRAAVLSLWKLSFRFMRCAATQWQTVEDLYCQNGGRSL